MKFKVKYIDLYSEHKKIFSSISNVYKKIYKGSKFILRDEVSQFEKKISNFIKCKYVVALNSGTDALLLGLYASGIKKGDEVITVSHTYVASISAIVHVGATPVFVDIRDDFNIDPDEIERKITKKTVAVLVVHLNGKCCEMEKIFKIAKKNNLKIIEDCAQSFGSKFNGKHSGTFGLVGCFSLHPMKLLNVPGDGGFVTTNSKKIYSLIRLLRDHGQELPKTKNIIRYFGFNSRLDNLHAAVAKIKIPFIKKWINLRKAKVKFYNKKLKNIKEISLPKIDQENVYQNNFISYVILCKNRNSLKKYLLKKKIEVFAHLSKGVHLQRHLKLKKVRLPKTEIYENKVLSLPIYPDLSKKKQLIVIDEIKKFYEKKD